VITTPLLETHIDGKFQPNQLLLPQVDVKIVLPRKVFSFRATLVGDVVKRKISLMAVKTKAITLVISRIFSACSPGKPITIAIPYKHAEVWEEHGRMEYIEDIGKKLSKTLNT
jgi:hypothetical protein